MGRGPDETSDGRSDSQIRVALITAVSVVAVALIGGIFTLIDRDGAPTPQPSTTSTTVPSAPTTDAPTSWRVGDGTLEVQVSYDESSVAGAGATFLMPEGAVLPESWDDDVATPERFARDNGGVPAGTGAVRLVLRSTTDEPLVVSDLRPVEERRRGLADAAYAAKIVYGCGAVPVRHVSADLDRRPVAPTWSDGESFEDVPLRDIALTVSRNEPETVQVQASTRQAAVDWKIRIQYTAPGADRATTLVVAEPDRPFTVTAVAEGTPVWAFLEGRGMVEDANGDPYGYC